MFHVKHSKADKPMFHVKDKKRGATIALLVCD